MKKPRYHYPLLVARTFLVGMFLLTIGFLVSGYCLLPEQIAFRAEFL